MKKMFTLNELIIVSAVSIIGLCSIATVTQEASKDSAVTLCADNMKKLVTAANQFAADHDNTLPAASIKVGATWQLRIAPYLGYKKIRTGWYPNDYPIFKCPVDKKAAPPWVIKNAHITNISYSANLTLIDLPDNDANRDGYKGGTKLDSVAKKDMTILFAENHTPSTTLRYGVAAVCYNPGFTYMYPVHAQKGYHDGKNNYAMLDGHVEYATYAETLKPVNKWRIQK